MTVSAPLPHDAARLHVTGEARYIDDIPLPANAPHLASGLSGIARGRVTEMDLSAVRAAPGARLAFTGADFAANSDCSPSNHDEPLLSDGSVHHFGRQLVLVAAESHVAARAAARLAKVDHAEETAVLSIDDALASHWRFEDGSRIYAKGDAAAAIALATYRIEGSLTIGAQEHFDLEGQAALPLPQEGGEMLVHSSSQHSTEIQHKVAEALELPMHAVRVEVRRMGGGFGGKECQGNALVIACALVAARTDGPAKMRYDQTITGKRHDFRSDYRAGVDAEGRVMVLEFDQYCRCGWAQDLSLPVADRAMLHGDNAYHLEHVRIVSHRLRANTQSATASRGFGGPQGMVGLERVMDHIAQLLGRDPLALRRASYYRDAASGGGGLSAPRSAVPSPPEGISARKTWTDLASRGATGNLARAAGTGARYGGPHSPVAPEGRVQTTPYHMEVRDFILNALTDRLAESCDFDGRRAAVAAWNVANPLLKRGLALTPVKFGIFFTLTHLNQAGALVHVYQDRSIRMNHGGTGMGQGLFQKVAQMAAQSFGVATERVKITATDTGKVPNISATAATSGPDLNGMAVKAAGNEIRGRLAAFLAERHQVEPRDVAFSGGRVTVGGAAYSFVEAIAQAYMGRVSLSATGFYRTPDIVRERIKGSARPFYYFAYGAACSEVVIDTPTGENRILRTDILYACGRSLNPALDIGQIEGGFVQGAGWRTVEGLVWDGKDALWTRAPSAYKIPACTDRPEVFNVALWDGGKAKPKIWRSEAVGEPPLMLGISALMALSDACAACGPAYPALDAPPTPERVLEAVARARGEAA